MILERAVRVAIRDDSLGKNLTDTRHQGDFRPIRLVDVDSKLRQTRLCMVDFDKPSIMGGLPGPVGSDGEEGQGEQGGGDGLIAAVEKQDRPAGRFALAAC